MKYELLDTVRRLQEQCPSGDPLEILYIWDDTVRGKIAKVLKPYAVIERWSGNIRWIIDPPSDTVELLALATSWQITGYNAQYALTQEQAEQLADSIAADAR
jgi:hypothetical protein